MPYANPEDNRRYQRRYKRRKSYGLTHDQFESLLFLQFQRCGICGSNRPNGRGWAVDHCHKTKKVRGILCAKCNVGGGMFNDDPALLQKAVEWFSQS
jgi:hypothetical protein